MRVVAGTGGRGNPRTALLVSAGLVVAGGAALLPGKGPMLAPVVAILAISLLRYRALTGWQPLLAATIAIILFVPIRRYTMPVNLPFQLEPYRLIVAAVTAGWLTSLLVDPRVRLRASGFEAPLLAYAVSILLSVVVNTSRVDALGVQTDVIKALTFFASFLFVFYLIVSVVRTFDTIDYLLRLLVGGGAVVAVFGLYESRTGYNVFNHLQSWIPILRLSELPDVPGRGARLRIYASAQHPIALGAMLVMLIPLAIYLHKRYGKRRWLVAAGVLALGALGTVSRTSVVMLLVVFITFLCLRPAATKKILPKLLPLLIVSHVAVPGALGSLKGAFFPPGGIAAEQAANPGYRGAGRFADLAPAMKEFKRQPLLGEGYGTRITDEARQNADILDNQWLGTLLETGLAGTIAMIWLFCRTIRRLGRVAKQDDSDRGWLMTAVAASIAAFMIGMFTFDAFEFIQVTFIAYILIALASAALSIDRREAAAT